MPRKHVVTSTWRRGGGEGEMEGGAERGEREGERKEGGEEGERKGERKEREGRKGAE